MSARANIPQDVMVPISVGELIDKIVILEIKSERIKNANQLANIANELGALRAVRLGDVDRARLDALASALLEHETLGAARRAQRRAQAGER